MDTSTPMHATLSTSVSAAVRRPHAPVLTFEPTQGGGRHLRLECPITPAVNPGVEAAHAHTLRWAVDHGLVGAEGLPFSRLAAARFTWLASRTYPTVDAEALALVSDWIAFVFFYDDLCDTVAATQAHYRDQLVTIEGRLVEVGHGAAARDDDVPLVRALADILERAAARACSSWLQRFGGHLRDYIEGCRWERALRVRAEVPSLATYTRLRPLISAVALCFDFAGMLVDGTRTDFADHTLVQQLEGMATNHICWVNDVYGLDKELDERTTSNLVIVLAHQHRLDWPQALDRAIELCNHELEAFFALEQQLAGADHHAYVASLRAWMRGNLDWYADTLRYCPHVRA